MELFKNIRHQKKRAYLVAYAETGNLSRSAQIAEIDRSTHYIWLREDETYALAFEEAQGMAADRLEEEARRRALEGVDEPVFYQGTRCGTVTKYSDTLLIFLMKGAMPDKYKDRVSQEHSGTMNHNVDIERMGDDEVLNGIETTIQAIADLQARIGTPPKV